MTKRIALALVIFAAMAANAGAACTASGTNPVILIPNFGDSGAVWSPCLKYDFQIMASSGMFQGSTTVQFSTMILTQNNVSSAPYAAGFYPNAPLIEVGNVNAPMQDVGQNLSTGTAASFSRIISGPLAGNASYYFEEFMNSSNFSQPGYSAEKSSATGVASSDSDMMIEAGINGGANGAASEKVIFVTSNPVTANIAGWIMEATASGPGAWVMASSVTVQNNAFGVGGSSFTVAGGSATVAYQLSAGSLKTSGPTSILGGTVHTSTFSINGIFSPPAWTLAQMAAYTPTAAEVGGLVMCSNCAAGWQVCKTTGTTVMGFQLSTGTSAGTSPCR